MEALAAYSPSPLKANTLLVGAIGCPFQTLTAALDLAASGVVVMEIGGGTYTEDIVVPNGVIVNARAATLIGSVQLGDMSVCEVDNYQVPDAPPASIGVTVGAACEGRMVSRQTTIGDGAIGALLVSANATLHWHFGHCDVGAGSFFLGDGSSGIGHIHAHGDDIYFQGAGGFAIAAFGAGQTFLTCQHIHDRSGTGTAFYVASATSRIRASVIEVECTAAWNVAIGARCEVTAAAPIDGTKTGLARVNGVYVLPAGLAIATYCPADGSVVPVDECQRLDITGECTEAWAVDIGGTMYWRSGALILTMDFVDTRAASENAAVVFAMLGADDAYIAQAEEKLRSNAVQDATDNWDIEVEDYAGAIVGSGYNTQTCGSNATDLVIRWAVGGFIAQIASGTVTGNNGRILWTKNNAPGNITTRQHVVTLWPIWS